MSARYDISDGIGVAMAELDDQTLGELLK